MKYINNPADKSEAIMLALSLIVLFGNSIKYNTISINARYLAFIGRIKNIKKVVSGKLKANAINIEKAK